MSQTLKFLVNREHKGQVNSNKSAYYKNGKTLVLINCGKGMLDAMKRGKTLYGVEDVYVIVTCSDKNHLADLKGFFAVLKNAGIKPKLIDSISLNKTLLKKMGINDGEDCQMLEPLSSGLKWVNFLATPHKAKGFSCPVELRLDGKTIFYGGDCGIVPFAIKGYDEYYFDFSDKKSEYHLNPLTARNLVQKNAIKQNQLFLVHIQTIEALKTAHKIGLNVAREEEAKLTRIEKKYAKKAQQHQAEMSR